MLFLFPIVLWWAKEPMRFAHGRSKRVLSVIIISSFVFMASQSAVADDRQSRDGTKATDDKVDPAETAKRAVEVTHALLREGTQIPPTKGQIVMLGRRWVFIVEPTEKEADRGLVFDRHEPNRGTSKTSREAVAVSNIATLKSRYGETETSSNNGVQSRSSIDDGDSRRMLGPFSLVATGDRYTDDSINSKSSKDFKRLAGTLVNSKQYTLAENLNLQRIVDSLRVDASDDQWILSGEVTEFFNENSLTIRTAQRSNHK